MPTLATEPSLTQSTVSALKWNYGGVFVKQVCTLAISVLLARLLGPGPFGIIAIAMLFTGFASLIADFGFSAALMQRRTLTDEDVRFTFSAQLVLAVILASATFAGAPLFAAMFSQPAVVDVIRVLSAVFVIQALGQVSASLLKRDLRFRDLQAAQVGSYVIAYGAVGIPLAVIGYGVWSLVAAQMAQAGIRSAWLYCQVRHPLGFARRPSDSGLKAFGAKVIATNVANWSISNLDNMFVGRLFTAVDLGLYTRMFVLIMMPVDAIVTTLQQVLFPAYSRAQAQGEALNRTYLASVSGVLLVVAPAALAVATVPQTVVTGLLGPNWIPAVPLLVPLALAAPFHAAMAMAGPVLWGGDAVARELRIQVVVAAVAFGALLIASQHSVVAVAWTVAGLYVLRCVAMTTALVDQQHIRPRAVVRAWTPGCVMALSVTLPVFVIDQLLLGYDTGQGSRLALDGVVGLVTWAGLTVLAPGVFVSRSLQTALSQLRSHVPSSVVPLLDQLTVNASAH